MRRFPTALAICLVLFPFPAAGAARAPVSEATEECLACHASLHPGIVADWRNNRHAEIAPETALTVRGLGRKVSAETVPASLSRTAVGCAECHTLRPDAHADTFDHNGVAVHVVVSPDDCAVCHVAEAAEYAENSMSHAHGNLTGNSLYRQLEEATLGTPVRVEGRVRQNPPSEHTRAEGCLHCHGTRLSVRGMATRETAMGEMIFPRIDGWPNQGAGRINTDASRGSCAVCHMSLVVDTDGRVATQRSHRMSDRLPWRIFGLIYAHPHPIEPDTTRIRNREGLPLPTGLDGTFASEYLISPAEQARRAETMRAICRTCHHEDWVTGHWERFEASIRSSNAAIRTATEIMGEIWSRGYARGIARGENPFDESVERMRCDTWLFHGNAIRFASAMGGGGDYGVFADGRYPLNRAVRDLADWLDLRIRLFPSETPVAEMPESGIPEDRRRLSLSDPWRRGMADLPGERLRPGVRAPYPPTSARVSHGQ